MPFNHDSEEKINRTEFDTVENVENKQQLEELQMKQEASGTDMSDKTIIAVGGAKGGVGKSALAANLAVGLALLGQELRDQYDRFCVSLVVNMAENRKDFQIAESMQRVLKEKCLLNVGVLGTMPFDKLARRAARSFTPIIVEYPRCQPSKAIHQMLAAILLDRDQSLNHADLLQKTNLMRSEAKDRIRSETMTLDGLTVSQINNIYDRVPKLRQSFQKILNIMTT